MTGHNINVISYILIYIFQIPMEDFYNIEDTMSTEEFFKYKDNLQDFLIQEK